MAQGTGESKQQEPNWPAPYLAPVLSDASAPTSLQGAVTLLALDRIPNRRATLQPLYELLEFERRGVSVELADTNIGLGGGSTQRATNMAKGWVGKAARTLDDKAGSLVSDDGRRIYRPPAQKTYRPGLTSDKSPTCFQANFVLLDAPGGKVVANGHYDITD